MENLALKVVSAAGAGYAGYKMLDNKYQLGHDIDFIKKVSKMKKEIETARVSGDSFIDFWNRTVSRVRHKTAILYKDEALSFDEVDKYSNQVANWLVNKGLEPGQTVALLMENRPEFLVYELGIAKAGLEVALINTSIKQKGLLHCVKISNCKMLIFGSELQENLQNIQQELEESGVYIYSQGDIVSNSHNANIEVSESSNSELSCDLRKDLSLMSTFGYIYTSGTTGLPKAAIILHQKMLSFYGMMKYGFNLKEDDIIYTTLPLFHSAGGGLGASLMFINGNTIAIKKKFSAKSFFSDCVKYKATVTQYIGELCRYLLLAPTNKAEKQHCLRIAIGNGLRPEIWDEFQTRFNIPEIGEFYGATEGNGALWNHCKKPSDRGACGRAGALVRKFQGVKIVKFDVVAEEPLRDPTTGKCIECSFDEPGELLFPIKADDPGTAFVGYKNKKATKKKVLNNAFVDGDSYFRTGDLLTLTPQGFFKFVDRIGDTFRWKGENCSTTEVTEVIATFPGVEECNVYGVQIPNNLDGRAPTAGITPINGDMSKIDLAGLAKHAKDNLPAYAVPVFLRIIPQVAVTATMKHQKVKLRSEGVDVTKVSDPLYWLNPASGIYEPFGAKELEIVSQQKAKL